LATGIATEIIGGIASGVITTIITTMTMRIERKLAPSKKFVTCAGPDKRPGAVAF
jgi:hypothetical protein